MSAVRHRAVNSNSTNSKKKLIRVEWFLILSHSIFLISDIDYMIYMVSYSIAFKPFLISDIDYMIYSNVDIHITC